MYQNVKPDKKIKSLLHTTKYELLFLMDRTQFWQTLFKENLKLFKGQ